ncbi:MAG TPA: PH domain-containing protein [Blastocatellia bacterium]|nr:PH domain-containing protein [Blastocatellia bacterium]
MIEEEIKPFELADEQWRPATGFQPLDSRVVSLWRVSYLIGFGVLLAVLLIPVVAVGVAEPRALLWPAFAWLALAGASVWFCLWYPPRLYRSWGYRIDAKVLETRSGMVFQRTRLLPLSRLQHVDIEQGPLERMFGLAALILHTAGTHSANIRIPGLEAAEATRLRDQLIEIGGDDAV